MREKKTHIYVDSQERALLLHSLVELKKQLIQQDIIDDKSVDVAQGILHQS